MDKEELSKIIDLCRKKGVEELNMEGIHLKLRPEAPPSPYKRKQSSSSLSLSDESAAPARLTDDELLFWSSAPIPEERSA